jgi:hypothetical protein
VHPASFTSAVRKADALKMIADAMWIASGDLKACRARKFVASSITVVDLQNPQFVAGEKMVVEGENHVIVILNWLTPAFEPT